MLARRMWEDYRGLNRMTKSDRYPMPMAEEIFDKLAEGRIYSTLDLRQGFNQIPIKEEDKAKTAFHGPDRLLRIELHAIWLEERLCKVSKSNGPSPPGGAAGTKCHFGVTTVAYLGFQVGEGGLSVQQAKVEVVDRLKAPTDCSTLRAQLGFLSYYRRFIPNFSKTAKPLSQLLRKDEGWKWWKEQERAWTTLKEAVKTAPLLKLPNPDEPFLLYTDWSSSGMCTVLCQEEKGTERVVAYVSRSCSPAESNYSSYEGEGLAAVWAVELFRPYLQGRKFTLVTDHQPLLWLMTNQTLKDRNARWAMHLQEFEFDVKHRPGKDFAACGWPNSPEARGRREERGAGRGRTYLYGGGPGEGGMEPEDRDSKGQLRDLGRPASARLGFRAGDRKGKKFLRGCECGGVHYRWQTDQQQLVTEDGWRIVPRPEEREALIVKVHTQLGHYAVERTVQMLQTMYWWAGLRREVKEVLARCEPCSQSKAKLERTKAELQSLPIGSIGYRWSLDMVGEMPLSRRGKQYIP
ncbi:hypothetical protein CLOM_g13324 [Closterium sp. NIES-68]|nr:hypothetical protein CLOM_g13324 [Closterium sp. NIES-68]